MERAHEVTREKQVVRLVEGDAVRVEAVERRHERPLSNLVVVLVVFDDAARGGPAGATHERREEAAARLRRELVGNGCGDGQRVRLDELRRAWRGDIPEEILV